MTHGHKIFVSLHAVYLPKYRLLELYIYIHTQIEILETTMVKERYDG